MRYLNVYMVAIVVVCLIISAGVGFCVHARQSFFRELREQIQRSDETAENKAQWEKLLDQGMIPPGLGFEVSSSLLVRIQIAELLSGFWYVWIVIVLGASFAVAYCFAPR